MSSFDIFFDMLTQTLHWWCLKLWTQLIQYWLQSCPWNLKPHQIRAGGVVSWRLASAEFNSQHLQCSPGKAGSGIPRSADRADALTDEPVEFKSDENRPDRAIQIKYDEVRTGLGACFVGPRGHVLWGRGGIRCRSCNIFSPQHEHWAGPSRSTLLYLKASEALGNTPSSESLTHCCYHTS